MWTFVTDVTAAMYYNGWEKLFHTDLTFLHSTTRASDQNIFRNFFFFWVTMYSVIWSSHFFFSMNIVSDQLERPHNFGYVILGLPLVCIVLMLTIIFSRIPLTKASCLPKTRNSSMLNQDLVI